MNSHLLIQNRPPVYEPVFTAHVPRSPAAASGRVLVVDDDPSIRTIITLALQSAGYGVRCADDGVAAWEALCTEGFDLLICDHEMPRLTGVDLLRRVRVSHGDLPVILISGRMPWTEIAFPKLLEPGCAMEKPFTVADLLANVFRMVIAGSPTRTPVDHISPLGMAPLTS